jgi:hypothetical protein
MKRQTVSCDTAMPAARRSTARARTVQSDFDASRAEISSAALSSMSGRGPPSFLASRPCPARASWPIRTALAAETAKRAAASRTVAPSASAAATRERKSRESGRAIGAGLLPRANVESHQPRVAESLFRFRAALTNSEPPRDSSTSIKPPDARHARGPNGHAAAAIPSRVQIPRHPHHRRASHPVVAAMPSGGGASPCESFLLPRRPSSAGRAGAGDSGPDPPNPVAHPRGRTASSSPR